MESTGKYWIPVFNVLDPAMEEVRVCNPKWLSLVKGEKDDNKDAERICDLYRNGMTQSSYIPSQDFRELRDLTRLRKKYVQQRTSAHNRLLNYLTQNNYKPDMVFSDVRGKSATSIINLIISGKPYKDEDILKCVHPRCRASKEDILKACRGKEFSEYQLIGLKSVQADIKFLNSQIYDLDQAISKAASKYQDYLELLCTIPGIDTLSASHLLAELGVEMDQFKNASQLSKWAGLAPGSDESAGKVHNRHITKGGAHLKPILVQCAWAAVKSCNPYYKCKFQALKLRAGAQRAIIAIARKILVAIYHMFTKKQEWHPTDCDESYVPNGVAVKKENRTLKKAIETLKSLGQTPAKILKTVSNICGSEEIEDDEGQLVNIFTGETRVLKQNLSPAPLDPASKLA